MRAAPDARTYARMGAPRRLARTTFVAFNAAPGPSGVVIWGRPDRADTDALLRAFEADLAHARGRAPLSYLVDCRRLDLHVDGDAYGLVIERLAPRLDELARAVGRAALVITGALGGALVAGVLSVAAPRLPTRRFTDRAEALRWLGAHDGIEEELRALEAAAAATTPLIAALRAWLEERHADGSLKDAAAALATSARSLQRALAAEGTSFVSELNAARVRAAQVLLDGGAAKITAVALEVGCASSQSFSRLFRRVTGTTPTAWRARQHAWRAGERRGPGRRAT